jgi:hypothetical protein
MANATDVATLRANFDDRSRRRGGRNAQTAVIHGPGLRLKFDSERVASDPLDSLTI